MINIIKLFIKKSPVVVFFIGLCWTVGIVINNANLMKYGYFSFHLLDLGAISSGFLFILLALSIANLGVFLYSFACQKALDCNPYWNSYVRFIILNLACLLVIILVSISFHPFSNEAAIDTSIVLFLLILFVSIIFSGYLHKLLSLVDKQKGIDIESCALITIFIILLLCFAFLFGRDVYSNIPRALGGGKPFHVQFNGDSEILKKYLNTNTNYLLIDETDSTYIIYDHDTSEIIEFPIKKEKNIFIKNSEIDKKELTLSFAADIHVSNSSNNKYKETNEKLEALIKFWNKHPSDYNFLLGDILEAPDDTELFDTILDSVYDRFDEIKKPLKLVVGNNDARNPIQINGLLNRFSKFVSNDNKLSFNWTERLSPEVLAIGLYIPNKNSEIEQNKYFNLDEQNKWLDSILEAKLKNERAIKMVLILSHQGFVEDNPWSFGFDSRKNIAEKLEKEMKKKTNDISEDEIKKKYITHIKDWEKFMQDIKKTLYKYDKDSIMNGEFEADIVVISGHIHDGYLVRKLDGIDHIVCPSFVENTRDKSRFDDECFLYLKYSPIFDTVKIQYKCLDNKEQLSTTFNFK